MLSAPTVSKSYFDYKNSNGSMSLCDKNLFFYSENCLVNEYKERIVVIFQPRCKQTLLYNYDLGVLHAQIGVQSTFIFHLSMF